jgi:hypothetical protein
MAARPISVCLFTAFLAGCSVLGAIGGPSSPGSSGASAAASEAGGGWSPEDKRAYQQAREQADKGLVFLEQLERGNDYFSGDVDKADAAFTALETFANACASHSWAEHDTQGYKNAKDSCALAATGKTVAPRYFGEVANKKLAARAQADESRLAGLTKNGWTDPTMIADFADPAAYVAKITAPYQKFGVTLDATALARIETAARSFPGALDKATRTRRLPGGLKPVAAGIASAARDKFKGIGKVLSTGADSGWTVSKNDLGIPESKWTTFFVLVQPDGAGHCHLYQGTLRMPYEGGGTYGAPSIERYRTDFQITRCR